MTTTFDFVCFLVAFILLVLAVFGVTAGRINLMAAGLAAFVLPFLALALRAH